LKRIIVWFACMAFVWVALAGGGGAQAAADGTQSSPQQSSKVVSLTGTVQKSGDGLVFKTSKATYVLAGHDLSPYVGKRVTVMGTISPPASKGGKKVFHVTKVK
jgi:hypothetical protein